MTPTDTTAPAQGNTVSFEFDLAHSPGKIWRALTEPELLAEWLLPAIGFTLEPGASFTLQGPVMPEWDGRVHCRVLEVDPQKMLRYAWMVGDMDTVVTFTLTPTSTGTRLSLVQSGFREDQKKNFGGARYGWRLMGGKLVALLERSSL